MASEQATLERTDQSQSPTHKVILRDRSVVAIVQGKLQIIGQFIPLASIKVKRRNG